MCGSPVDAFENCNQTVNRHYDSFHMYEARWGLFLGLHMGSWWHGVVFMSVPNRVIYVANAVDSTPYTAVAGSRIHSLG